MREFLTLLAVCHTVVPERDKEDSDKVVYQVSTHPHIAADSGSIPLHSHALTSLHMIAGLIAR